MSRYRLAPAAQRDLSLIWNFTEERWDVRQAEAYLAEIKAAVEWVADDPRRGHACDEIRGGYRRYSIGSHLHSYVVTAEGVDVMRILRQRVDPSRHL